MPLTREEKIEKITNLIIMNSFNRNCPQPYVIDDRHSRELAEIIVDAEDNNE